MVNPNDKWKYQNFLFLFDYIIFVIFLITFDVSLIAWLWLWNRPEISSSIAFHIIFRQSKTWFYNYSDSVLLYLYFLFGVILVFTNDPTFNSLGPRKTVWCPFWLIYNVDYTVIKWLEQIADVALH